MLGIVELPERYVPSTWHSCSLRISFGRRVELLEKGEAILV